MIIWLLSLLTSVFSLSQVTNGRSWSRESLGHIENTLKAAEVIAITIMLHKNKKEVHFPYPPAPQQSAVTFTNSL